LLLCHAMVLLRTGMLHYIQRVCVCVPNEVARFCYKGVIL